MAVDALSGEQRVFDEGGTVPMVDAVAASSAVPGVWPPVTIDGRRYIDGGFRLVLNADLAEGYDSVLILAPIEQLSPSPPTYRPHGPASGRVPGPIVPGPAKLPSPPRPRPASRPGDPRPVAGAGRDEERAVAGSVELPWG